ncbi:MAG: diacylglycerol/lipid kinase family protein [Patescibacteria group bacterium]
MIDLEPIGIIINPYSGGNKWKKAEKIINKINFDSKKVKIFKGKEVYESTCKLFDWANLIIVVGGDGSLNSAVQAIVDKDENPALLFIPTGTANDMAYNLNLPKNIEETFSLISKGKEKKIDIGQVNVLGGEHVFVNVFGLSASAELIERFKRIEKNNPKFLSYLGAFWESFFKSFSHPEVNVKLEFEKSKLWTSKREASLCLVSNGERCGRFFKTSPNADMEDGLVDFCFRGKMFRFSMVSNLISFITGRHIFHKSIDKTNGYLPRVKGIEISLEKPKAYQIDGDVMDPKKYFYIKVLEKRLRVLVPK